MTLITVKSKSIPKRAIIGLNEIETNAKSASAGGGTTKTYNVKTTQSDMIAGFLDEKIIAGSGITKTVVPDSNGVETLVLNAETTEKITMNTDNAVVGDVVYISALELCSKVVDNTQNPIGVVNSITGEICDISKSGIYSSNSIIFSSDSIGKSVYWSKNGYTVSKSLSITKYKIGIVKSKQSFYINIIPIDEIPNQSGNSGNILSTDGTATAWNGNLTLSTDYVETNKTLKINKQGDETGAASAQSIYSPDYTTWEGKNGLFIRNNKNVEIISTENGSISWLDLNNTNHSAGVYIMSEIGDLRGISISNNSGVSTAMISAHKMTVPVDADTTISNNLAIITNAGALKQATATTHAIKTTKITLTRAQVLALNTTPILFISGKTNICNLPIKAIWRAGSNNYYSGTISLFFGTTYASAKVFASLAITGTTTNARYTTATTPSTPICENYAIYIGAASAITDSGTSDSVTIWLEYTEIDLSI